MHCKFHLSPTAVGSLLSLLSLPVHLLLDHAQSVQLAGMVLAVIAGIYIGFALQRGSSGQILIELAGAGGFIAAALYGLWVFAWLIPVAYVLHGVWDYAHHRQNGLVAVPRWYPPFCAVYDWIYAAGLSVVWMYR